MCDCFNIVILKKCQPCEGSDMKGKRDLFMQSRQVFIQLIQADRFFPYFD